MRLNYNYQSGTFIIEAEDKEEAIQLKNAAMDIANMISTTSMPKFRKRRWRSTDG